MLAGVSGISPEMALRLAKSLGRSPESWLALQYSYDLWQAKQQVDLSRVGGFGNVPRFLMAGVVGGRKK